MVEAFVELYILARARMVAHSVGWYVNTGHHVSSVSGCIILGNIGNTNVTRYIFQFVRQIMT